MAAGTSAAAALHASDAQNEHLLNNDDEEEAPPCQRRRVGTSPDRDMLPLAADDSLVEGEGGVDEGTSRLALAANDNLQVGEGGGVEDVDDGEWMGSADLMEDDEVENLVDEFNNEEGLGAAVASLSRKDKLALDDNDLFAYFFSQLATMSCLNIKCGCLEIVTTLKARSAIAKYLTWFERRTKHEQDSIVFEWCRYVLHLKTTNIQRRGRRNVTIFRLPYLEDDTDAVVDEEVQTHLLCSKGLQVLLNIGKRRYLNIRSAAKSSAVLPTHKGTGKANYNAVKTNDRKYLPLKHHFEYLLNLGEVRATRVVATLVDGMGGHVNRDDNIEVTYLPISMGYRPCYKRYMKSLGYDVRTTATGGLVVTAEAGKEADPGEYVSFPTYYNMWKRDYKNLKVSRPAEDICKDCYVFANRHRHLAHHGRRGEDVSDSDDSCSDDNEDAAEFAERRPVLDLNNPDAASNEVQEERELMLMQAAKHVEMARAQRALYQAKVADAVADATAGKDHTERRYTFVVDYGQNMELPSYNDEQPGITYYYSPLSVYNLGMVDHAHRYNDGRVAEHLHCHVYHEGVGKKGATNVASLIMKTLRELQLLREDAVGGELNIIFDNCSGQNKNNTVLKLALWIMAMGYFKSVQFIFLVVGHTKNAADRLFNLLKEDYRRRNLFTFDQLATALDQSPSVTIHRTVANDFLDYDSLLDGIYRKLVSIIKQNHIFACVDDDGFEMRYRESNLREHQELIVRPRKKHWKDADRTELIEYAEQVLKPIPCVGLNPYKMVEMYKNYRPVVPVEYHPDVLYENPSPEVWSKVKVEKTDRSEFRANLKAKKYAGKERVESAAFNGDAGKDGDEGVA